MAWESPSKILSFPVAHDMTNFQFYPVYLRTDGTVSTISTTATKPLGVIQDAPDTANAMGAVCVMGVSKTIVYNGTIANNDAIGVAATGIGAVTTTDNQWVVGDILDIGSSGVDANQNIVLPVLVNVHRY